MNRILPPTYRLTRSRQPLPAGHPRLGHGPEIQDLFQLGTLEEPLLHHQLLHREPARHGFLGEFRRLGVADPGRQRGDQGGARASQSAHWAASASMPRTERSSNTRTALARISRAKTMLWVMTGIITLSSSWPASAAIATVVSSPSTW